MNDLKNGILPVGVHDLDIAIFIDLFCFTLHRFKLFNGGLRPIAKEMASRKIESIFVDGSFVEQKKAYPNDIDCFFEATLAEFAAAFPAASFGSWQRRAKEDFKIHIFPCITQILGPIENGRQFKSNQEYWHHKFGHTRELEPKGIVKLSTRDLNQQEAL